MKILLVDDEHELVATLAERLEMRGYEVDWSTSGATALEKACQTEFSLAILDMKMPQMDGLVLRKKLEEITPTMRFIFMTGHGSEETYQEATSSATPVRYLIKPVNISTLTGAIDELTNREGSHD
ncbi:MAG: response regulator [Thermodesulfobacteriota bacterium]